MYEGKDTSHVSIVQSGFEYAVSDWSAAILGLFFAFVLNLHHVVLYGRELLPSPIDSKPLSR